MAISVMTETGGDTLRNSIEEVAGEYREQLDKFEQSIDKDCLAARATVGAVWRKLNDRVGEAITALDGHESNLTGHENTGKYRENWYEVNPQKRVLDDLRTDLCKIIGEGIHSVVAATT